MTMTIAIERQKSEMRAVLRCPAMQTLTKWVTAMLFISLIWHAPQAHAAWASSEVVISAGAAVVLDRHVLGSSCLHGLSRTLVVLN